MIRIAGSEASVQTLLSQYPAGSVEYETLEKLAKSNKMYEYTAQDELSFEINLRKNIINSSYALYRGRLGFRTFRESRCNEAYWNRNEDGGFVLKTGIKPSDAIMDIFINTRKYATECATAIMMIYYKAVLDAYGNELFDRAFPEITLMNWQHLDELMGVATFRKLPDYLPGDCRYFRNPDVNPLTPEWQGENAIDLGGGLYYGHGIGIGSSDKFIAALNENRIEGAQASAYLMDIATRPDFNSLYQYKKASVQAAAAPAAPVTAPAAAVTAAPVIPPAASVTATPSIAPAATVTTTPSIAPAATVTTTPIIPPAAARTS